MMEGVLKIIRIYAPFVRGHTTSKFKDQLNCCTGLAHFCVNGKVQWFDMGRKSHLIFCEHFFYRITQKSGRMARIVSKLNLYMRWILLQYSYNTMSKIDDMEIAACRTDSWFLAVKRPLYCNWWNCISLMVLNLAVLKCKAGTFLLNCTISIVSP